MLLIQINQTIYNTFLNFLSIYSSTYYRWGRTPEDDARTFGHDKLVDMLQKYSKSPPVSLQEEVAKLYLDILPEQPEVGAETFINY